MGKNKQAVTKVVVDGKITLIHTEERFPYSTDILMQSGFPVILLNMVFGLLPTTLNGTSLKYLRCSVAQLYALAFGICMIILSYLFIPVVIMEDVTKSTGTGMAVMVIIRITHVGGFIFLLIRGHSVAKRMPKIWTQTSKLIQIAIVEVHGRKYHGLKSIGSYARWSVFYYVLVMGIFELEAYFFESKTTLPNFVTYYHLPPLEYLPTWLKYTLKIALILWEFCSLSHVLVSMLVCYLIVVIKTCLRSINDLLMTLSEGNGMKNPLLARKRPLVKVVSKWNVEDELVVVEKLNTVKNVMVVAEDLTANISKVWGLTLIVEVLILIANLLVNMYYILIGIRPEKQVIIEENGNDSPMDLQFNPFQETVTLLNEAIIHSYFFYRLCCASTDMVNEAKQPLQVLKSVPYETYSKRVQEIIQTLKSDLSSTSITLTATNYFQINKFLLTSVTGALTTYIVVLLQFQAQEAQNAKQPPGISF